MAGTWLFAPFLFNPSGFEWQKILDDWTDWHKWISNCGGIGVPPEKSWESWWENEQEHLEHSGMRGIATEIILALRFFIYHYGLVYHLSITDSHKSVLGIYVGRRHLNADLQLVFRLIEGSIFITFLAILIILICVVKMTIKDIIICILAVMPTGWGMLLVKMTIKDIIICILAVMPTGWGILLFLHALYVIAQACKPLIAKSRLWGSVRALARGYEVIMGLLLFTPVAFLAWFPFVSEFQTRMLFNQAFSRGLQISRILGGQKRDRANNKE